jgi:plasmid stabilization system protein ParE
MACKIIWSPAAADDLEAIVNYISRDSTAIAANTAQRIVDGVDRLEMYPLSGPAIREWKRTQQNAARCRAAL